MLMYLAIFILALLPSLFWLVIYYWEDREEPEPKIALLRVFIVGMAVAFLVIAIEGALLIYLPTFPGFAWLGTLPALMIGVAVIEESLKLSFSHLFIWHKKIINQILDGAIYSIVLALGLALVENFVYFSIFILTDKPIGELARFFGLPPIFLGLTAPTLILIIFFARFLVTTLMHTITSGLVGIHLGRAWFQQERWQQILNRGLFWAILIHAAFNILAVFGQIWLALAIVIFSAIYFFSHLRTKQNLKLRRGLNNI